MHSENMKSLTTEQAEFAQKFIVYMDKLLSESLSVIGNDERNTIFITVKRLLGTAIRNNLLRRYESLEVRPNKDVSVLLHFTKGMSVWMDLINEQ